MWRRLPSATLTAANLGTTTFAGNLGEAGGARVLTVGGATSLGTLALTGTNTYSVGITPSGGSLSTFTGTLGGTAGSGIDRVRLFNFNAGNGGNNNAFFNNIVVPEPTRPRMETST